MAARYRPRFVSESGLTELINLFHLSKCPLSGTSPSRYDRVLWASSEFHKAHPEVSSTAAYKDLDGALSFGRA